MSLHNSFVISGIIISILIGLIIFLALDPRDNEIETRILAFMCFSLLGIIVTIVLSHDRILVKNSEAINSIFNNTEKLTSLSNSIKEDHQQLADIRKYLSRKSPMIYHIGSQIITNYLNDIKLEDNGFGVEGEYWALKCYRTFWEYLLAEQQKRQRSVQPPMIARITHSSDIRLWMKDREARAEELLILQQEFVKANGIIVRILIGPDKVMSGEYQDVKRQMEKVGIEVKYIAAKTNDDRSYDFLWLNDENYVLLWYTGVGPFLSKCVITDSPDPDIGSRWRVLATRAEKEDSKIFKIPEERSIK